MLGFLVVIPKAGLLCNYSGKCHESFVSTWMPRNKGDDVGADLSQLQYKLGRVRGQLHPIVAVNGTEWQWSDCLWLRHGQGVCQSTLAACIVDRR